MSNLVGEDRLNAFFATLSDELRVSQTVRENARERLLLRMRKRAGFVNQDLDHKAIEKFLKINNDLKGYSCNLNAEIEANARHFIVVMLERYFSNLSDLNIQVCLDTNVLYDHWRFGPGASNGVKGTHTAEKIEQDMTYTTLCEPYVKRLRASNPYFIAFDSNREGSGLTPIYGSRLTTVPKNEDTVRTIAIEPSGNMAMQLAAGRILEGVLAMIGCDIGQQQPKNKALACRGSKDGSIATIDLSSASDMISIDLVRRLLPSKWFKLLMDIRSPQMEVNGQLVELSMMSTMGNGFTFPLMTLIMCSLIYGYRSIHGGPNLFIDWSSTAVFGDDIIVKTEEYNGIVDVLTSAGLIVNNDKSFCEGSFRESCGGDYDCGVDITPFYVKNLQYDHEIYVAANQLLEWSAKHKFYAFKTLRLLFSWLRTEPYFVPEWCNPDQGVKTSQVSRRYKRLELEVKDVRLKNAHFAMPLACAGYIKSDGLDFVFNRRVKRPFYRVRNARLPRGYLDGADPLTRSDADRSFIAFKLAILD